MRMSTSFCLFKFLARLPLNVRSLSKQRLAMTYEKVDQLLCKFLDGLPLNVRRLSNQKLAVKYETVKQLLFKFVA